MMSGFGCAVAQIVAAAVLLLKRCTYSSSWVPRAAAVAVVRAGHGCWQAIAVIAEEATNSRSVDVFCSP